jgi:hypothetical protein
VIKSCVELGKVYPQEIIYCDTLAKSAKYFDRRINELFSNVATKHDHGRFKCSTRKEEHCSYEM